MGHLCPESHTPGTPPVAWHSALRPGIYSDHPHFSRRVEGQWSVGRGPSLTLPLSPTLFQSHVPSLLPGGSAAGSDSQEALAWTWPDLGRKPPGFELASGCSQWADRIGYSVSFTYLKPHHRNLLVPKNCLLALSEPGSCCVHKHNNDSLLPAGTLWSPVSGPSSANPLGAPPWPRAPPASPGRGGGVSLPSVASPLLGTPPSSSRLPRPQDSAPPPALGVLWGFALVLPEESSDGVQGLRGALPSNLIISTRSPGL